MAIKISSGTNAKKGKQAMVNNGSITGKGTSKKANTSKVSSSHISTATSNALKQYNAKKAGQAKAYSTVRNIVNTAATTNARAAATANSISKQAQEAQMAYNAKQAAQANAINQANMQKQMEYNAQQAQLANQISKESWNRTAEYNTAAQSNAQAYNTTERLSAQEFNKQAVEEERAWQEKMAATEYQRRMQDLKLAGLNPILAYTNGGASVGGGAAIGTHAASISPASVGSISGTAANAGLLGANSGSASSYTGQMENTSNQLALFGAVASAISSAIDAVKDYKIWEQAGGKTEKSIWSILEALGIKSPKTIEKELNQWSGF